jgi:hypothetical protein
MGADPSKPLAVLREKFKTKSMLVDCVLLRLFAVRFELNAAAERLVGAKEIERAGPTPMINPLGGWLAIEHESLSVTCWSLGRTPGGMETLLPLGRVIVPPCEAEITLVRSSSQLGRGRGVGRGLGVGVALVT